MKVYRVFFVLLFATVLTGFSSHRDIASEKPISNEEFLSKLQVNIINVGQADAIYIVCPHGTHQMLIDAGEISLKYPMSDDSLKSFLQKHQSTTDTIELVVATHPHSDHIGNMAWVLNTFKVGTYYDNGREYADCNNPGNKRKVYCATKHALQKNGAVYTNIRTLNLTSEAFCDKVELTVLKPEGYSGISTKDENAYSIVLRLDYGSSSFLFTGDAEEILEHELLVDETTRELLDCDFLKVGHHGSKGSSTVEFLEMVSPEIAAISSGIPGIGQTDEHGHPRTESIQRIATFTVNRPTGETQCTSYKNTWNVLPNGKKRFHSETYSTKEAIYCTSTEGHLLFTSDGTKIIKQ